MRTHGAPLPFFVASHTVAGGKSPYCTHTPSSCSDRILPPSGTSFGAGREAFDVLQHRESIIMTSSGGDTGDPRTAAAEASGRDPGRASFPEARSGGSPLPDAGAILTPQAIRFLEALERTFGPLRRALLEARRVRQERLDAGELPSFPAETAAIREGSWRVAPPAKDLCDRRVEITGPAGDAKMVINALN